MRVQFRRILCATDFSEHSNRGIDYGAALAAEFDAKLCVCHVIDLSAVAIYGEFQVDPVGQQSRIEEEAREQFARMLERVPIQWESVIRVGRPADEIARVVGEQKIDLVVAATRGRSGLKRLLLGSVTERLMRTLSCPLLVCGQRLEPPGRKGTGIRLENILIGCDFSRDSALALDYGLSLAQEFESQLHLVHVIEPPVYQDLLGAGHQGHGLKDEVLSELLLEKLDKLVPEEARNWCRPETALLEGHAWEALVDYAEHHEVDLIVLGVRGHGAVKSLLLGSTTDRVARGAPCPVLSVSSHSKPAAAATG